MKNSKPRQKSSSKRKDASKRKSTKKLTIGIVMGSESDWPTMRAARDILKDFGVRVEAHVVSAHRTPQKLVAYAESAKARGIAAIIAGAGGAAHLPGMLAAVTPVPVLGVPIKSKSLSGLDSLLSIAQMPAGIPVATFSIGEAGAKNAALFVVSMLARSDARLDFLLSEFRRIQTRRVLAQRLR